MEILTELEKIQKNQFMPCYILVGEEFYFQEKLIQALREKIAQEGIAGFNEDIFQAKEVEISQIITSAKTLPMMASKKFVLVRNADTLKKDQLEALSDYLEDPNPSTCLIMTAKALDGRSRFVKLAKKMGALFETKPLQPRQIKPFIRHEAQNRGHKMNAEAMECVEQLVENDLSSLVDAIERLSLFVGENQPITPKDIESSISASRVETIWKLVDSISNQNRAEALRATSSMLSNREPALRILFMVTRQFRILCKVKHALAQGLSPAEAAKSAGAPPFKARELSSQARKLTFDNLEHQARVLFNADQKLKSSKAPPELILENTILQLCDT